MGQILRFKLLGLLRILAVSGILVCTPAFSQQTGSNGPQKDGGVTTGTVVSATTRTMVIRTEDGEHVLFVFESDTTRPRSIPAGSRVRVVSRPDREGLRVASNVQVTAPPPQQTEGSPAQSTDPVPTEVRRLERQIERQIRRFRGGVRTGVGLDPEVIAVGAHAKLGPFFHRDVFMRPNVEFAFGEVTTLVALNLEAVYRLPITERQSRWSVYIGAGPGFNFIDQDFEAAMAGERDINFDDFDFEASLNLLAGVEFRNGMFLELKSTAYSRPQTRLLIGYSF